MALHIELKSTLSNDKEFSFNKTMLHAVQSGLSVIYGEVFIWSCGNHLGVWVVGQGPELLFRTFSHHSDHYKEIQILDSTNSISLLEEVAQGISWTECDLNSRMASMQFGYKLSKELDSFGVDLLPLIINGMNTLQNLDNKVGGNHKKKMLGVDSIRKEDDTVAIAYDAFCQFSFN